MDLPGAVRGFLDKLKGLWSARAREFPKAYRIAIDWKALVKSKPFLIACACALFLFLVPFLVMAVLNRPIEAKQGRVMQAISPGNLKDFRFPEYRLSYERLMFSRDPGVLPGKAELSSLYRVAPEPMLDQIRSRARSAVETFFQGVE
jgi:hypothetical protein